MSRPSRKMNCETSWVDTGETCQVCGCRDAVSVLCEGENERGNREREEELYCPVCDPMEWFPWMYSAMQKPDAGAAESYVKTMRQYDHLFWNAIAKMEYELDQLTHTGLQP